jgi:hypothetical protein
VSAITLFTLAEQYKQLEALFDSGDVPEEVIRDTLEGLQGDIAVKAKNVAFAVRNLEAGAAAIKEASKAMAERAARVQRRADSIRNYLLFCMQATGTTRLECEEFTIAVRENPPAVVVNEDASVPAEYMVQEPAPPPRPDKKALKEALQSGKEIRGVWLERGVRLEIKT